MFNKGFGLTKSAIFGAISGAASFGVGEIFQAVQAANTVVTAQQVVAQALTHGFTQGVISAVQGGDFGSSFASAAVSSLLSAGFGQFAGSLKDNTTAMVAFSTVSGGGVAALTGGNFWQGAATAFYVSMLNHAAHEMTDGGGDKDQIVKFGPDKGTQVMEPASTWWERLWYTMEPRIYTTESSFGRYQVDADGKVVGVAPLGGAVEFGPGKGAKYLAKMLSREGTSLVEVKKIGDFWKYTTKTMARNGNGSYTITSKYLNAQGKTIRWFHDTYTKTGTFLHRGYTEGSTKVHLWWNGVKQYGNDFFQTFR